MSQELRESTLTEFGNQLSELGYSMEAINNMSVAEMVDITFGDIEACSLCNGEKVVAGTEYQSGDNIAPGGFYESGESVPCPLCSNYEEENF